jgi:hypothetical protein
VLRLNQRTREKPHPTTRVRTALKVWALFCALCLTSACHKNVDLRQSLASAATLQAPSGSPKVLAAYQPWFGSDKHINVGYSNHDPQVAVEQIRKARELGISGFVVNWYGPRKPFEDKSYELIQKAAAGANDFTTSIMYDEEAGYGNEATEAVIVDLQYAYDRYIGPNAIASRSAYLRYNGRPVIFIFPKEASTDWNRVRQTVNSWEDPPLLIFKDINQKYANVFDGFYAWVQPGKEGWKRDGSNWGEAYLEDFYSRMNNEFPTKIAVGAAWPGFDDTKAAWSRNRHMDDRCGRTFEDSVKLFRRYFTDSRPLPFLMVVTWNDYEEGTAIERGFSRCNGSDAVASGR